MASMWTECARRARNHLRELRQLRPILAGVHAAPGEDVPPPRGPCDWGMAAFVPSRKDPAANEVAFTKVREDKTREANDGFDGTWVAHPDLVPVAGQVFDRALQGKPNQLGRVRDDVDVTARDLLDVRVPGGNITEAGLRSNVRVAIQYLDAWPGGTGAATISDLMEDTA